MLKNAELLRSKAFLGVVIAAVTATITLNVPGIHFEALNLWVRILCPMLIFIGIWGSLYQLRFFRLIGWFGILLYLGCVVGMVLPGEDHMSGGPNGSPLMVPNLPSVQEITIRLTLLLVLILVLVVSYIRLGVEAMKRPL